jgi:hypothetical protein
MKKTIDLTSVFHLRRENLFWLQPTFWLYFIRGSINPTTIRLLCLLFWIQQLPNCGHQDFFHGGGDLGGPLAGFVTALCVGDLGADVARRVIALGGHRHEQIRAEFLGGELIFHEQLARQEQHAGITQA